MKKSTLINYLKALPKGAEINICIKNKDGEYDYFEIDDIVDYEDGTACIFNYTEVRKLKESK